MFDKRLRLHAFGRLRQVKNQSNQLVEESWYNGLGYRIVVHSDVDGDGDVDGSDQKFHLTYDTSWRVIGEFCGTDTDPKGYYLHHNELGGGARRAGRIELLRRRGVPRPRCQRRVGGGGDWDDASDGTLEERLYYCQNWRADVIALITAAGGVAEGARYSPYGVPFGMPRGDVDGDGVVDSGDTGAISYATPGDVRQDLDLDGDVDVDDFNLVLGNFGATAGRGVLSTDKDDGVGNMLGYAGYVWSEYISRNHVRNRVYDPFTGRWNRRDPLGYVDGVNMYEFTRASPLVGRDHLGLSCIGTSCVRFHSDGCKMVLSHPAADYVDYSPGCTNEEKEACRLKLADWMLKNKGACWDFGNPNCVQSCVGDLEQNISTCAKGCKCDVTWGQTQFAGRYKIKIYVGQEQVGNCTCRFYRMVYLDLEIRTGECR